MNALETEPARIFVVEDNAADVYLIREALKEHCVRSSLRVASDGRDAVAALIAHVREGELPDLILLDLNLTRLDGKSVLRTVRAIRDFDFVPVVILTSSSSLDDQVETKRLGANEYIVKPRDLGAFLRIGATIKGLLEQSGRGAHDS